MNLHIAVLTNSSFRLNDEDCAAAARRRRRKLFIVLSLVGLSWMLIAGLVLSLA